MTPTLLDEIKQRKPFKSIYEEAALNILRTSALLSADFEQMFKPYGITATQYNVLRILRGADDKGLCRNDVRDRLLNRMPDATRLLDRMEKAGLVSRSREQEDRRLVATRLTKKGRELVDELDPVVARQHKARLGHLSHKQLATLNSLLTLARTRP
ncbi:MAG: MarR family transcriptional regulator [Gemmatimonadaceae bacterium]|nr:MarR family transcriptional regulator [Gemmatimonadaceae bacterium]